jgi:hypothetical protein
MQASSKNDEFTGVASERRIYRAQRPAKEPAARARTLFLPAICEPALP